MTRIGYLVAPILVPTLAITAVLLVRGIATGSSENSALASPGSLPEGEQWLVTLTFETIGGLSGGLNPLQFGVFPGCTDGFEVETDDEDECDEGRSDLPEDFIPSFYYPNNDPASGGVDPQRLLISRTQTSSASTKVEWPLRIKLPSAQTVTFSWKKSDIANIPDSPEPREVKLLEGLPDSAGTAVIDFRNGTSLGGGWTCTDEGTTVSCEKAMSGTEDFTIRVAEAEAEPNEPPTADAGSDSTEIVEGDPVNLDGSDSSDLNVGDSLRACVKRGETRICML